MGLRLLPPRARCSKSSFDHIGSPRSVRKGKCRRAEDARSRSSFAFFGRVEGCRQSRKNSRAFNKARCCSSLRDIPLLSRQLEVRPVRRFFPPPAPDKAELFANDARAVVVPRFPHRVFARKQSDVDGPPADMPGLPCPCDHRAFSRAPLGIERVLLGLRAVAAGNFEHKPLRCETPKEFAA